MGRCWREVILEMIELARLQTRFASHIPSVSLQMTLLRRMRTISKHVPCAHNTSEPLSFIVDLLAAPKAAKGCIVEAGCYKGGSTSKFSIFARLLDRPLVVFDSFEGLPPNAEDHNKSILGHSVREWFQGGRFSGSLDEVRHNVSTYGEVDVCRFVKGWFDETMPLFRETVCAAYLDVDLASSTRTCLKHLYPLLVPGGVICSQDGDFPLVIEVLADDRFWEEEVGCGRPHIEGLGRRKLIRIVKPAV